MSGLLNYDRNPQKIHSATIVPWSKVAEQNGPGAMT